MGSLMVAVTILNLQTSSALAQEHEFLQTDPAQVTKLTEAIDPFTPALDEDAGMVLSGSEADQAGTLKKPEVTETIVSPRAYTVVKGDTLSTVAEKFGLTVATLLETNDLKGTDTTNIKIGQQLTIPPENTSTSLAWLDEETKARQEREQKARERAKVQLKIAQASSRRVAGRASTREVASGDFEGSTEDNLIVPIHNNGVSRCRLSYHPGTDYRADVGTPVMAAASGRVSETTGGWGHGFGNSILLDHGRFQTRYGHLSRIAVDLGETVSQGQIIGYSGNTGFSTGPHLHFEKVVNGRAVPSIC